jgi:hypothetical protein
MQTIITLSSCEAEYIALSESLQDMVPPLMNLINEFKQHGFEVINKEPTVYCKAFEDNSGALKLAHLPKMQPHTKHINVQFHHFHKYVWLGLIKVFPISTDQQLADIFTKPEPLAQNAFLNLWKALLHY